MVPDPQKQSSSTPCAGSSYLTHQTATSEGIAAGCPMPGAADAPVATARKVQGRPAAGAVTVSPILEPR
jgi:hypothetical protein